MNELDIIFITKIQYTYIHAIHYMRDIRLELAGQFISEALSDIELTLPKVDPNSELYNMLIDLRYKMTNDLTSIEDASSMEFIDGPPAANYTLMELVNMVFPCISPLFNTRDLEYKHKINKLQNVNNLLHHENETLKQTLIQKCKQD